MLVRAAAAAFLLAVGVPSGAADPKAEITPALGNTTSSPVPPDVAVPSPSAASTATPPPAAVAAMIERGAYLARIGGCNDCHTPSKPGPDGPEPDTDRMLSGHPEAVQLPAPPALPPGPWNSVAAATNTAFAGPWGISYATNLTPDRDTGIGTWTERVFVDAMRTGRHPGTGRPILPPMPWRNVARLTDDDLRSLYRYLGSIPPVANRVPDAAPAAPAATRP